MNNIRKIFKESKRDNDIIIYSSGNVLYVTDKGSYELFLSKKEEIEIVSRKLLYNKVMNDDPCAEALTMLGLIIKDEVIKHTIIVGVIEDTSLTVYGIEDILDKSLSDDNYYRRSLSKHGIEIPDKIKIKDEMKDIDIERLIDENRKLKEIIKGLDSKSRELDKKEETLKEWIKEKETLEILFENLKEELYRLREWKKIKSKESLPPLEADKEFYGKTVNYPEGFELPVIIDNHLNDSEILEIKNMNIRVPKKYKKEISELLNENSAVAVEYFISNFPYLLPYIYKDYD